MGFKEEAEALFGSDEIMGVYFMTDNGDTLSWADYELLLAKVGVDNLPGMESLLPGGGSATCCTDYAAQVCKAFPGRAEIVGFANEDNPTSRVAREELHPMGHDFAIVDNRYLVDPWVRLVLGEKGPIVFDLLDAQDALTVADTYGPRACWARLAELEPC